ncbi:MAG: YggS family pyridoxal phosphate-dependent enzyme [Actinomycetota bacterium]
MNNLIAAVTRVRRRIDAACARSARRSDAVTLIGATKHVPADVIVAARAAGIRHFAENYAKELEAKAREIEATWHFIGTLQAGTARKVADHARVVHSAEPGGGLTVLARRAASSGRILDCLAQVDFTGHRQGVDPDDLDRFLEEAAALDGIRVVGLMTLPPLTPEPEHARPYFRRLRDLRDGLLGRWPTLRELSMGMSADFEIAVEEGATMVRVGTALFGLRPRDGAVPGVSIEAPGDGA